MLRIHFEHKMSVELGPENLEAFLTLYVASSAIWMELQCSAPKCRANLRC